MLEQLKLSPKTAKSDLVAGLTVAMVNIPEGMAYALVAGVNPLYGLYSGIVPPIVGALTAGSAFMMITLTSETAMTTAATINSLGPVSDGTLFAFTMLVGLFTLIFGLLKLGRLLRFVSESVMTGFVTGTVVLMILGQLGHLTGYESHAAGGKVAQTFDLLLNFNRIDIHTTIVGLATIAVIVLLHKTPLHKFALILGLIFSILLAGLTGWESVALIGDVAEIPRGLPLPALPDFSRILELIVPALSLAILVVVVSAGVAQNYPNPDGSVPDSNRDFIGLGAANIVGGLFQSLSSTGSMSRTAVGVSSGAQSRWVNIFAGLILALFLVTIGGLAELIPNAGLAGLLIFVGSEAINEQRIFRAWNTHFTARIGMVATFILALVIPLQYAIYGGVIISLILYLVSAARNIQVIELAPVGDGRYEEREAPAVLAANTATIIQVQGATFFAAIDTMQEELPSADNVTHTVLILHARGRETANNTFLTWLERYAKTMHASGNLVMMASVDPNVKQQLEATKIIDTIGRENIFLAQPILGASLDEALAAADKWLKETET